MLKFSVSFLEIGMTICKRHREREPQPPWEQGSGNGLRVWNRSPWKVWIARRVSLGTISAIKKFRSHDWWLFNNKYMAVLNVHRSTVFPGAATRTGSFPGSWHSLGTGTGNGENFLNSWRTQVPMGTYWISAEAPWNRIIKSEGKCTYFKFHCDKRETTFSLLSDSVGS